MKKLLERLKRLAAPSAYLVAFLAAALGASTASAAYANGTALSWKSRDSISTKTKVDGGGYTFKIKIPCSDDLPKYSKVKIKQIKIGARANKAVTDCGAYIQINGVNSDTISAFDGTIPVDSDNTQSLNVCNYVFSSDLYLLAGIEYAMQPYNSSGSAMNSQTAAIQPLPNPQVIYFSADVGYCCAYEVYGEVISTELPIYKASGTGLTVSLNALSWTLDDEATSLPADLSGCGMEVTLEDGAALTIDKDISSLAAFVMKGMNASVGSSNDSYVSSATDWDFSSLTGELTVDASNIGSGVIKPWLVSGPSKVTVKDDVSISWSSSENPLFTTHTTFDGGTSALTIISDSYSGDVCNNSSNSDPWLRVKDNTVLNLTAKDLGGYAAVQKAQKCVIAVDGGGRLNLKDNGGGTFYYQGRFLLSPDATLDVQTTNNRLRFNGGRTSGYEQIYVPDQSSDATDTPAKVSGTGAVNANNNGFGIYVGENAQLDWSASIVKNDSAKIVKNGAGTLKISGIDINFPIEGSGGTIELSATKTYNKITVAQDFSGKLKLIAPTTSGYWWGFTDLSSGQHLPGRPELELDMPNQNLFLTDGYNNGAYSLTVKNLSGSAKITSSWGGSSAGNKIIDSLQTANTTFSGTFTGDDNDAAALTVRGADNAATIYSLTLSSESDTHGPLTIENNAKVVFSSTGKWSGGTVTVMNGGVLESQNSAAVAPSVELQDRSTVALASGVPLTATGITIPASGTVYVDMSAFGLAEGSSATIISVTTLTGGENVGNLQATSGHYTFAVDPENANAIKATNMGTCVWDGDSWNKADPSLYSDVTVNVAAGGTTLTLDADYSFDSITLSGSSGSLTIDANGHTLTVGDIVVPNGVTLVASSALTVTGSISGGGNLTVPNGVTFTCAEGTKWYLGSSSNPTSINSGNITVENGGEFIINGWVEIQNTYNVGEFFTGLSVADGGLLQVNSTGTIRNYDNPYYMFQIAGGICCNGSATLYNYGKFIIKSTGAFDVSATANITVEAYTIDNSGILTLGKMRKLTLGDGSLIVNVGSGKIVFAPTDAYLGETVNDMTTIIGGSGTPAITFDVSNLTSLPTGTSATTLLTTSAIVPSLTGCSADYYVKQDGTTGAVTLQLYAAKDSAGVYYDNIEDAFDAVVADHNLTVTILDGTEATYAAALAEKGLGRNEAQVFHLVAERLSLSGVTIAQYPTAQAAIAADGGDSIVAIYEAAVVAARATPIYIKPVGIALADITINCAYAGFSYVKPDSDLSGTYGPGFAGVYQVSRTACPATFTWNPEVDAGDWNDADNWTSDDGEVFSAPNNSNYTVILGTAASINTGTTTLTLGKMEVDAAVSITGQNQQPREFSFTEGVVFTSDSAMITLLYSYFADGTVMSTTVPGKYVRFRMPNDYKYYDLVNSAATVYDAEDNAVNGYSALSDAVAAATEGQKIRLFANSSDAITLNGKSITLIEGDYTFSGTFTGNGTLTLSALLKSAAASMWAAGWTGTVWLQNYTDLRGTSIQGNKTYGTTNFEPNNYGNSNSTVRFTGVKGYLTANDDGSYTIQPALELEDDGDTPALLLYNGWGYNSSARCYTIIRELKGSGTLAADTTLSGTSIPGLNVLLQVRKWDNFTGTLNMPNKNIVFGSTLPAQADVEGGGHIAVQSGASVEVPAGKTWTVGNGVVVNGGLSLGTGAAIANTTPANTWVKRGTGTITLNAPSDLPATPASTWQGTIVLPAIDDNYPDGFDFSTYGVEGSTIQIANGFNSWLKRTEASEQPAANFEISSSFTITGTSADTYVFKKLSGTGDFTISDIRNANSFTISVLENFSGNIINTLGSASKQIVITRLNLDSAPTLDAPLVRSTTAEYVSIQSVYVAGSAVSITTEARSDGIYATTVPFDGGTMSEDGNGNIVASVTTTGTAVTLPAEATKLELTIAADGSPSPITAEGVDIGDVVVKFGDTVTTEAYSIVKNPDTNVISFDIKTTANASVTVGTETIKVQPEPAAVAELKLATVDASTKQSVKVKTIPGLWYSLWSSETLSGTTLANPVKPTNPIQATGTETAINNGAVVGSNPKYYKVVVGATADALK